MIPTDILDPVLVQVFLTFGLMFWMARSRVAAVREGQVRFKDIALREQAWPGRATQIANCFHNQLELPILFYLVCTLALVTKTVDIWLVVLAWVFVAARLAHAYIHTHSNKVMRRFQAFQVGALVLVAMWVWFSIKIIFPIG